MSKHIKVDPVAVRQIADRQRRLLKRAARFEQVVQRLSAIENAVKHLKGAHCPSTVRLECLRYVPVALVACVQGYFKLAVRDIVDKRRDCLANTQNVAEFQFNLSTLLAIQETKLSLGTVVSSMLPLNDIAAVFSAMDGILATSFTGQFDKIAVRCPHCDATIPAKEWLDDIVRRVSAAFTSRHMLCHELAHKIRVGPRHAADMIDAVNWLLIFSETTVANLLKPRPKSNILIK